METGPAAARTEFRPSYRRAAPWQASFAILTLASGLAASLLTRGWAWAVGGIIVGALVPFTLLAIVPTNRRLLASTPLDDRDAFALLQRWGRVPWIRSALRAVGLRVRLLRAMARAYLSLIGEAGLPGALFPEAYGGSGRGVVAECIVDEELAAAGHPADTIRSVSLTLGTISILRYGTEAQKKRHIPPRISGEELAAIAITEPQIGSDTSRMQTRAVLKGDRWVINGQKRFITGGGLADYLTLFAITDAGTHPHKGMSTFIVPVDHPGVTIARQLDEVILADWMDNALIEFHDVDIPAENLLGPLNGGYHVLMDELDTERVTYCMAALGSARRALEIAAEYSTKRVQCKQPIAMFEGVSFKLAEMYTCLDAARQLIYRTAKMIEAGVPAQRESAVTKLFTAEAVWKIVDHAMQVLGGIGYTTDFPVQAIL